MSFWTGFHLFQLFSLVRGSILFPFPCEGFNQVFSFLFYYWVLLWGEQPSSQTVYALLCGVREGQYNHEQHENAGPLKLH